MAPRRHIRAVIFDWGGTLTPWHSVEPRAAWLAALTAGGGGTDDAAIDRLQAAEAQVWLRSRDEHRSGTLSEVFAAAGIPETAATVAAFHGWWEPHTHLDPDVPALFAGLHARDIKVGVLSNTIWSRAEHERIFARDGVLDQIDGAVYSCEIPWTKPHPEAFRAALDAVAVDDPGAAVFVGDRPFDDIHGAAGVGMHTILVPHSEIPAVQRGPVAGTADAVVQRLADVLAVVDELG